MGIVFSSLWQRLMGSEEIRVVILGLDAAGKTTLLYKWTLGETISTAPTVGSNEEIFKHKNVELRCFDVGGQSALRSSWSAYYSRARAVVMVIDSQDRERLPVARKELHSICSESSELAKDALLLVMANKQDVRGCLSAASISEGLGLTELRERQWHIQACSALTGQGLESGLDWLVSRLGK